MGGRNRNCDWGWQPPEERGMEMAVSRIFSQTPIIPSGSLKIRTREQMARRFLFNYCILLYPVLSFSLENSTLAAADHPTVRWTVQDSPDFRYRFLEKTETTRLLYATPETGTFNHHGYLAYFEGTLFASWDNHARDENASGQNGVFRFPIIDSGAPQLPNHSATTCSRNIRP